MKEVAILQQMIGTSLGFEHNAKVLTNVQRCALKAGGDMSDQTKMAVLGSAAIIIALLLWVYFSFLN